MATDGTGGGPATVNTNDIPIASGTGISDYLSSQGTGYGLAITNNIWFFAGIGIAIVAIILVVAHFRKG